MRPIPDPDDVPAFFTMVKGTIEAHFIGGSIDGKIRTIDRAHGDRWQVYVPDPIPFPTPFAPLDLSHARARVETYRRVGSVRHTLYDEADVMVIDTMPEDAAQKALADLLELLNRRLSEEGR